ncbi:MAG TPA: HYR domain-containing protein [Pyrinomonadaceae bacterium]|nr:HYR domain-containing protein [Pyrinomonadaceae bacterium]
MSASGENTSRDLHVPHYSWKSAGPQKGPRIQTLAVIGAGILITLLMIASPLLSVSSASSHSTLANAPELDALFLPVDGTITIKSGNYIGSSTTETAKFTKQIFSSTDCTTGGGSIDTVTGVDSTTGHSFTLGSSSSVQITIPDSGIYFAHVSEQNGPFVSFQVADNSYQSSITYTGDGHQVCIQGYDGPGPRTYLAQFYAGIQFYDSCGVEKYSFRPGESMTIKVTGGIVNSAEQMRLMAAGGSVNECTFLPTGPSFTTVHVSSDPFIYNFTLPASNAEIYPACASSGTTSILGQWRVVTYDVPGCGCNRNDVKFTVAEDAPLPSCTLTCPDDITVSNAAGSCGANVTYTTPTAPSPATVTCDHPSGSNFPVGTTLVTCTSSAGPACSFNVTVNDTENPTITAPAGFTVGTNSDSCVATGVSLGTPTTADNCAVSTVTNNSPGTFTLGPTTVTWTVTDNHGRSATADQIITVVDNTPPTLTVPADSSAPADSSCQAAIPNVGDDSTAADNCGAVTITQSPLAGTLVGPGPHVITVTATDTAGNYTGKNVTFTVIDVTPPTITLNGSVITFWSPNHSYSTVDVASLVASATDNCDAGVNLGSVYISKVTSDETETGNGNGNTTDDIVIAADCKSVQLRAERQGGGNGRVYTITFKVVDASGNASTATAKVTVPNSQNGNPAVDDGPNYTVSSSCP